MGEIKVSLKRSIVYLYICICNYDDVPNHNNNNKYVQRLPKLVPVCVRSVVQCEYAVQSTEQNEIVKTKKKVLTNV